jgi:nicotinamide mononucleotide (NMN) deamidase PncC
MSYDPFAETKQMKQAKARETAKYIRGDLHMATVESITGGLFIKIDGEAEARTKSFKRCSTYTPAVGHRVLIAKISGTYVVLDRVV